MGLNAPSSDQEQHCPTEWPARHSCSLIWSNPINIHEIIFKLHHQYHCLSQTYCKSKLSLPFFVFSEYTPLKIRRLLCSKVNWIYFFFPRLSICYTLILICFCFSSNLSVYHTRKFIFWICKTLRKFKSSNYRKVCLEKSFLIPFPLFYLLLHLRWNNSKPFLANSSVFKNTSAFLCIYEVTSYKFIRCSLY